MGITNPEGVDAIEFDGWGLTQRRRPDSIGAAKRQALGESNEHCD